MCRHATWLLVLVLPPLILPEVLGAALPLVAVALVVLLACLPADRGSLPPCGTEGRPPCGTEGRLSAGGELRLEWRFALPLLALLVMLAVAYTVSGDRAASLPKATASLAGIILFWVFAQRAPPERGLFRASLWLTAIGGGVALLGLIGTDWQPGKLFTLWPVYDHLPRLVSDVPRSTGGGFSANQVGGALAMCAPAALGLAIHLLVQRQALVGRRRPVMLWLVGASALLTGVVLFLTQSRTAYVGAAAGLVTLIVLWRWPHSLPSCGTEGRPSVPHEGRLLQTAGRARRLLAGALALVAVAAILLIVSGAACCRSLPSVPHEGLLPQSTGSTADDGATRLEVWTNALRLLDDYALTGAGLNTFPTVSRANYAYAWVPPDYPIWHSHNVFLQIGVDLGLPGLAAFVTLLFVLALCALHVVSLLQGGPALGPTRGSALGAERGQAVWLAAGLSGSLMVCAVAGLGDASTLPLGLKSGLPFWIAAGALAGAWRSTRTPTQIELGRGHLVGAVLACALVGLLCGPAVLRSVQVNRASLALDRALVLPVQQRAGALNDALPLLRTSAGLAGAWQSVRLGRAYRDLGDDTSALAAWQDAPVQAIAYLNSQGDAQWQHKESALAEHSYRLALLVAENAETQYRLARVLEDERAGEALLLYAQALAAQPGLDGAASADTYLRSGRLYARRGDWAAAMAQYDAGLAEHATSGDLLVAQAQALAMLSGDAAQAEAQLVQASVSLPANLPLYRALAALYLQRGDVTRARTVAEDALRAVPGSAWPHILLGQALLADGRAAEAVTAFRRAAMMRRNLADPLLGLAAAYQQLGDHASAVTQCAKASQTEPYKADVQAAAGHLLRTLGQSEAARQAFRRALALDPHHEQALLGLQSLDQTPPVVP